MSEKEFEAHANKLHQQALVIDAHADILIPVSDGRMRFGEMVSVPDPETWEALAGKGYGIGAKYGFSAHTLYFGPMGQYDLPRMKKGGVTVLACAIYIGDHQLDYGIKRGLEMAWHLYREVETCEDLELVTMAADISRLKRDRKCGIILSFEGCEALGSDVRLLDIYYKLGLRIASLTHCRRNYFAEGVQPNLITGGLTEAGRCAIRRMNELGIVVDLVHINETGFWEILDLTTAPVVLSHSSGTMFAISNEKGDAYPAPGTRPGLVIPRDRPMLEAIARNGGVIGIIAFDQRDIDDVVADIETAMDVMGPDHVGLGSDYYGIERAPKGLEDISKYPNLTRRLVERGHDDQVILKVLGGNFMRVFEQVWKA
ncbi:MAG: membrane dipeptidase [Anaerolineales bacterium]|nr:membrane dipeptidase [Anaerolineales bacterium]